MIPPVITLTAVGIGSQTAIGTPTVGFQPRVSVGIPSEELFGNTWIVNCGDKPHTTIDSLIRTYKYNYKSRK